MFSNFVVENLTGYEIMWQTVVQPHRPQMTIMLMRIACCLPKATNTHSEYVILFTFPLQQWLHDCASTLRYTYITSLFHILMIYKL
jgi:hypothetical protein